MAACQVVAGAWAFEAPWHRYALFCVAPGVIALAVLIAPGRGPALRGTGKRPRWPAVAVWVVCVAFLVDFQRQYFARYYRIGNEPHETYWTGPVEPKQAAADFIISQAASGTWVSVRPDSWWTYWPLRYLTTGRPRVGILPFEEEPTVPDGAPLLTTPGSDRRLFLTVGFVRGRAAVWAEKQGTPALFVARDFAGQPIVCVWGRFAPSAPPSSATRASAPTR
jgi:hypothetical protein